MTIRERLEKILDYELVDKSLDISCELWLLYNNDKEYTALYNRVKSAMATRDVFPICIPIILRLLICPNNHKYDRTICSDICSEIELKAAPFIGETTEMFKLLFSSIGETVSIEHEPNGKNECPDLLVTFEDGMLSYIEVKSVLCTFNDDGTFNAKINNAMKDNSLILEDLRYNSGKNNLCNIRLRNITIVFLFYCLNPDTNTIDIFRGYAVPAPLAIDCEFTKNGEFYKLGQKSNNNNNTVLNLKIRSPYNKYNTLYDRIRLIIGDKTSKGLMSLISNQEGDYMLNKKLFSLFYTKIMFICNSPDITELYICELFNELKTYKYNKSKYTTPEDKLYIKDTINKCKLTINNKFGKGTVR